MENSQEVDFKVWIQTLVPVVLKVAIFSLFNQRRFLLMYVLRVIQLNNMEEFQVTERAQ